jgi:protein-tyrosine sulfotransferase
MSNYKLNSLKVALCNLINHKELQHSQQQTNIEGGRNIKIDNSSGLLEMLSKIEADNYSSYADLFGAILNQMAGFFYEYESRKYILEKTPLQEEFAVDLYCEFPNAKFIHIIRNPYSHAVTLRKRIQKRGGRWPNYQERVTDPLKMTTYYMERNKKLIKNYLVLKYEDLISQPQRTMSQVCAFLNIEFDDVLLTPTILGNNWKGNSMYDNSGFSGVDSSNLYRW